MDRFYRIAGVTVQMDSYGRTAAQARPYEIPAVEAADIQVNSFWKEVKQNHPEITDDDGEYLATGSMFYGHLLKFGGMMLHSSAVVVDGRAYLFSADSGVGKSTHTQLWLSLFGSRAYILNDDKPAIRREKDGWFVYGTPWSGKYDISVNTRIPLAGIAMVERAEQNRITPFSGIEAIRRVMAQLNKVSKKENRILQMDLLNRLFCEVPVWRLCCNMEKDAAVLSYEAMSGRKFEEA